MRPPSRLLRASLALLATCILTCGTQGNHAITGTVTGASAVTVNLTGAATRTATTDGTGGYAFTGLADGDYTVTPVKTGYTFTPASMAVTVAGADVAGQDFAATPVPHAIAGTVTGASAVTVNLTGAATRTTTTDVNGGYAFTGLADGDYTVTPVKTGYTFTPASLAVTVAGADVAGQDFAATPVPHAIAGTVTGASAVTVNLTGAATRTATTDGTGGYAFTGLADGDYTVTPVKTGYTFTPASLAVTVAGAGVAGQDFAATPVPHAIAGTVSGASSVTVNLIGAATRTTATDGAGGYAFTGLADGDYTVTPVKTGYSFTPASLAVTVAGADVAGQDFSATEIAPPSRTLTVRVTYPSNISIAIPRVVGPGISCPRDCTEVYADGERVTLTAQPAMISFAGWIGCDVPSGRTCTMAMTSDKSVTARFVLPSTFTVLTVLKAGSGSGTVTGPGINCGSDCTDRVTSGTVRSYVATPDVGSSFAGWAGCTSSNGTTCTVSFSGSGNRTITATFSSP